jgi:biopolymer transport protein TolQ
MRQILFALAPANANGDFVHLIRNASLVVKLVLVLLLLFSVISWAIIIFKSLEYGRARRNALGFLEVFKRNRNLAEIGKMSHLFANNPLGTIFRYGLRELASQNAARSTGAAVDGEALQRALLRGSNLEISRLERLNGFLATTAAVTPFIGLFGTVWGIMTSFQNIGLQQNTSLATVAPGIAEALVATALGLFAAIPAVIFYNALLHKLKLVISLMEDFTLDFQNTCQRLPL